MNTCYRLRDQQRAHLRRTSAADGATTSLPADTSCLPGQVHRTTWWALPAPPLGSTSTGSPSTAWATNHHRPTWTSKVEAPPLGRPGSEAGSWVMFSLRSHRHVSQPSWTIFKGVGTSSRRLESGDRFGETLRPGTHPTYSQRTISLVKGDRG